MDTVEFLYICLKVKMAVLPVRLLVNVEKLTTSLPILHMEWHASVMEMRAMWGRPRPIASYLEHLLFLVPSFSTASSKFQSQSFNEVIQVIDDEKFYVFMNASLMMDFTK